MHAAMAGKLRIFYIKKIFNVIFDKFFADFTFFQHA